jgi:PAS domain S-box-containing protein
MLEVNQLQEQLEKPRADLVRVLLAEEDDTKAFVLHCEINRLSRPSAFQRAPDLESLRQKLTNFRPTHLIVAPGFVPVERVKAMAFQEDRPCILCIVENAVEAEAALRAGADDCLLASQWRGVSLCIETHLNGNAVLPFYKVAGKYIRKAEQTERVTTQLDAKARQFIQSGARKLVEGWRNIGERATAVGVITQRKLKTWYDSLEFMDWLTRERHWNANWEKLRFRRSLRPEVQSNDVPSIVHESNGQATHSFGHPFAGTNEENEALRTLELSFKILFNASFDPVFLLDSSGHILHLNPAGSVLFGSPPATILGRKFVEFTPSGNHLEVAKRWESLLVEGSQNGELQIVSASGALREIAFRARTNLWFGVHLLIARDQTELKSRITL